MTNLNLVDFIEFVGPTETLIEGGRVLEVSGFAGSGDVVGPTSAVDDRIAIFDGTSGKLIQDGGSTIAGVIAQTKADMYSGLTRISVGTSTPGSPSVGDLWIDTN